MAKNVKKKNKLFLTGKIDYVIVIVVALLLCIGGIMLLSASAPKALAESGNSYEYALKQLMFIVAGTCIAYIFSKIDYRIYKNMRWFIYAITVLVLLLVGFFGLEAGGARRWLAIGKITIQPSEFAKLSLLIFFASLFSVYSEKGKLKNFWELAFKIVLSLGVIAMILIFVQNHFSTVVIMATITGIQLFAAGLGWGITLLITALGAALAFAGVFLAKTGRLGFRGTRIITWLNIENAAATKEGYQILQSLCAIGSGGFLGLGLGNGRQKYSYLPEAQNDFIFPIVAEELGFIGAIVVIILFLIFIWRGFKIASETKDVYSKLIAVGATSLIGVQALINMAVVTNTIPVTGVPLPFFSYGGSAMLTNLWTVGILLAISRRNDMNNKNDFENERIEK